MIISGNHDLTPDETGQPQRTAELVLVCVLAGLALLLAGSALGLMLAPKDDSTLGVMRALVFRCH